MKIVAGFGFWYQAWFWITMALIVVYTVVLFYRQLRVLRGIRMENPDGSADDWHDQQSHYGIGVADIFLACPASLLAVVLSILELRYGLFLLGAIGFWYIWANIMTTATSMKFHNPKLSFNWWITFPFGSVVGLSAFLLPVAVYV